jgi:chromosome segregation ATPase
VLHQYETNHEPVRPILDHELSTAIGSLQNSTAAIEEQCKLLETQRDALMALKALDKPNLSVEHMRNERRRKENQEKARLDTAIDDISITITEQLTDTQRDIDGEKSTLKSYLTERLASDDQILSKVPGIVSKIASEPEASQDENSIDQWCQAIVFFRTAEVKAKVDVAYLNSLTNSSTDDLPTVSEEELKERKADLQAELETLHSEIASVAEMVVEHELRKPMTDIKDRKDRERTQARSAWLNYVRGSFQSL